MTRGARIVAAVAALLGANVAIADVADAQFKRGATLVEFFNFSATTGAGLARTYADPAFPRIAEKMATFDFDDIRRIGFDHMRVPIDAGPMMRGDERQRGEILAQLVTVIAELQRHDLNVLVTVYPPSLHQELPETYLDGLKGPKFQLYFDMVMRIARTLAAIKTGTVALEPMNEPQSKCRVLLGADWTDYQQVMVERIRAVAPDLPLFLTGGCWSNIEGIVLLNSDILRDRRNFISVHFYYPFLFTHQTATWTTPHMAGVIGVPYPAADGDEAMALSLTRERFKTVELAAGSDRAALLKRSEREIRQYFQEQQGRAAMEQWMQRVADWQARQRVPADRIVFTEFGAMKQTINGVEIDKASRARWLHDAASTIQGHGWGWTVYVLRDDPFGLYLGSDERDPDPVLLKALGLTPPNGGDQPPR